jgi:hypothetical protein
MKFERIERAGLALILTAIAGCAPAPDRNAEEEFVGQIELSRAAQYFSEYEELCREDDGRLWNVSLCGPLIIVDPATRDVVANLADGENELTRRGDLFVGELPSNAAIANTATEWAGTRWTMLLWWSLPDQKEARDRLLAHEAFHRVQPELGLEPTGGEKNRHLDTAEGRFWLQLEWSALRRALSLPAADRGQAVEDALVFRSMRRESFPDAGAREVWLEVFEGLAEYTGHRLAGSSNIETVELTERKQETLDSFVRSFAYVSGPLYGFLLDEAQPQWRETVTTESDLGVLLANAMGIVASAEPVEAAETRASSYDGDSLRQRETEREGQRRAESADWTEKLIDGPVLILDLTLVSSGSFNPNAIFPLSETQTVYYTRELIARWGVATVDGGGILEDDAHGKALLAFPDGDPNGQEINGDGWVLKLTEGWRVVPASRPGDFTVVEESP